MPKKVTGLEIATIYQRLSKQYGNLFKLPSPERWEFRIAAQDCEAVQASPQDFVTAQFLYFGGIPPSLRSLFGPKAQRRFLRYKRVIQRFLDMQLDYLNSLSERLGIDVRDLAKNPFLPLWDSIRYSFAKSEKFMTGAEVDFLRFPILKALMKQKGLEVDGI